MELTVDQALEQAVAAHNQGDFLEAERIYQAILRSQPSHPDANHNLGLLSVSAGDTSVALRLFKTALDGNPTIEQFWISYIDTLAKDGQIKMAKGLIKRAKKKGINSKVLTNLLLVSDKSHSTATPPTGQLQALQDQYQAGQWDEAEVLSLALTKKFPKHQFGWKILGAVLGQTGRPSESLLVKQHLVKLDPEDAEAHFNLGNTFEVLSRADEAIGSYLEAIVLKPDFFEAHCNMGNLLKDMDRYIEAIKYFEQAISLRPTSDEAHYNLGLALFETGQYPLALKHFEISKNTPSEVYVARCLIITDQGEAFDKKYDSLVDQGVTSSVMGTLATLSEIKYGIKKFNPFCSEPLKYVCHSNIAEQYDFKSIFVATVDMILTNDMIPYRNQGLLKNGIQTEGDIFLIEEAGIIAMKSIIQREIEKYRHQFMGSEAGFIKNWPGTYKIKGWIVCMENGGQLAPHIHENGWISGSVYINVPPKASVDSGNLVLCLSDDENTSFEAGNQKHIVDVEFGSLCLFPASLYHYTIPFDSSEERIVLAFDVVPDY